MKQEHLKKAVRERYGAIAEGRSTSCCGSSGADRSGCGSQKLGYEQAALDHIPEGADLGLGCGNPTAFANIKSGEVVVDLGSGAGIDCFLAAKLVGPAGRVIGVDMTAQMLEKARLNAEKTGDKNVEFRLGELEHLPIADSSVDLIISNCVINLVPDKQQVFREMFRVLKPGGRIMVSDIVLTAPLPDSFADNLLAYVGCVSGAILIEDYQQQITTVGFESIEIDKENGGLVDLWLSDPASNEILKNAHISEAEARDLGSKIISAKVSASKPH